MNDLGPFFVVAYDGRKVCHENLYLTAKRKAEKLSRENIDHTYMVKNSIGFLPDGKSMVKFYNGVES